MNIVLFLLSLLFLNNPTPQLQQFSLHGKAQGTTWQLSYFASDSLIAQKSIDSIFQRIDSSMSLYLPNSLINRFNAADTGLLMDQHLAAVVQKAIDVYHDTKGVFDMTVLPLVNAWGFGVERGQQIPDSARIRKALACVGTDNVLVEGNFLRKKLPCVQLDLNGIAQGYTVDLLARFLEEAGIGSYIVELGGEIRVKGRKPNGERMRIGIEAPGEDEGEMEYLQRIISIDSGAVTSSGHYRRDYESGGTRISHIIDPRSGYPTRNELISVTVIAADAITADAYDNVLMVLGLEESLNFLSTRSELNAHFIYRDEAGRIRDSATAGFY